MHKNNCQVYCAVAIVLQEYTDMCCLDYLAAFCSTILDPVHVHIAETVAGDSRSTEVIVFINIHVEHRIEINKVLVQHWLQCF